MMLVSTKGYIIDCFGPYLADSKNNDAEIVKHQFTLNKEEFLKFFKTNDIFVVDRGFRDCIEFLEDLGMNVFMPNFLYVGKQHTTKEANESRIVTKNRWVVEAINGLIKKWLYFSNVVPNNNLKFIAPDFKILCAIINKFRGPRLKVDQSNIAEKMLNRVNLSNDLMDRVKNFSSRVKKSNCITDPELINFPKLTEEYLCELSFGSYQLKQAKSYVIEHLTLDGKYQFEIFNEIKGLIRTRVKSRHSSQTIYNTYIEFEESRQDPISGWYCSCKSGARVVGCCAHVISVLWFLGHFRYNSEISKRSSKYIDECFDADKLVEDPSVMSDDEL